MKEVWIIESFESYAGGSRLDVSLTEEIAREIMEVFIKQRGWKQVVNFNKDHHPETLVEYWHHRVNGCILLHKCHVAEGE